MCWITSGQFTITITLPRLQLPCRKEARNNISNMILGLREAERRGHSSWKVTADLRLLTPSWEPPCSATDWLVSMSHICKPSPVEIVLSKFPALPKWRTPLFPCIKTINALIYFEFKSGSCFPDQTRTKPLSLRTTVLTCRLAQRSLKHPVLADLGSQLMGQRLLCPSTKVKLFLRPELLCALSSPHWSSGASPI